MAKIYVKKANKIEAIQYNGTNVMEIVDFVGDVIGIDWHKNASLEITTSDGIIECCKSEYLIKDHKGKLSVCDVDEFKEVYNEVKDYDYR
jgi:hypothetical protein